MKYAILSILLICVLTNVKAQQVDSTEIKLQQMKTGIIHMRENLNKAHSQFSTGTTIFLAGAGVAILSVIVPPEVLVNKDGSQRKTYDFRTGVAYVGALANLVGLVFMIDSHKYIGRAGKWKFNGTGISMEF